MSEGRQLEVRRGDMVLVSVAHDGEAVMLYMSADAKLYDKLDLMQRFLLAQGHSGLGPLGEVSDFEESQWAVDVRNFLDDLTDPEVFGFSVTREIAERAARLRDA